MKRTVILLLLLPGILSVTDAFGQRVKYKDLFPTLQGMTLSEQRNALTEYTTVDLDHPNANFRLALIYEANYKSADPLTEIEYLMANANQARLLFLKCTQLLDDKEMLKNNEYYFPTFKTYDSKGKPFVEPSLIEGKVSRGYDSAVIALEKIPPIYKSFTRSVHFYDKAVKEFAKVNSSYLGLDDLYMFFDANVDQQLAQLKQDFDSAKVSFDRYLLLTKAFPIPYHKQKYHVKPIVTYRLDGLITRMNFLTDDVEFWDYASWVDQVKKNVNTDIAALRARLIFNEEKLDESIVSLSGFDGKPVVPFRLEKQLVYNLNNYDKQSLALAVLEYKAFKQDWLIKSKSLNPDTINFLRNAEMYSSLIYSNRSADTLVGHMKVLLQPDKIRKHQQFFEKFYGTTEGIKKYAEDEQKFIDTTLTVYSSGLKSSLLAVAAVSDIAEAAKVAKVGKISFPYKIGLVSELMLKGEPVTLENRKNHDGSVYLAGVYIPDKKINNMVTYVVRVNPDGKPAWVKNFDFKADSLGKLPDANNLPGPVELTQEGCIFVVRSSKMTSATNTFNHLVYLNEKGEEKFKIKLKEKNFARKLTFVEVSNSFVVLLKGIEEKQDYNASEPVTLLGINALGDAIWRRDFDLTGSVTDLVKVIDGYIVIGNYAIIRDLNGKEFRTKAGSRECSPYVIKLNEKGEIMKINAVQSEKSIFVSQVIKVNDTSINLIGLEGTFDTLATKGLPPADKIKYMMVNRFSDPVFSGF
jgi:hypothetical protein